MAMGSGLPARTCVWDREHEWTSCSHRSGRSESRLLVLRGEAGIGKTVLLEYLIESASDLKVARATGAAQTLPGRIEGGFVRRLASRPEQTRVLLLVATRHIRRSTTSAVVAACARSDVDTRSARTVGR
jgi:hypothetical protein